MGGVPQSGKPCLGKEDGAGPESGGETCAQDERSGTQAHLGGDQKAVGCLPGEESGAEGKGSGGVKEKGGENPSTKSDPALTHIGDCIRYWLNNEGPNKQTFGERGYSLHGG